MTYYPQVQTKYEINANVQLKEGSGTVQKLIIHIRGESGVWRVWDSIGMPAGDNPGRIVWAAQFDNPRVQEACIVDLDWPFDTGLFLQIPPKGVCTASWL
jgi:hypothetical protein